MSLLSVICVTACTGISPVESAGNGQFQINGTFPGDTKRIRIFGIHSGAALDFCHSLSLDVSSIAFEINSAWPGMLGSRYVFRCTLARTWIGGDEQENVFTLVDLTRIHN